MAIGRAIKKQVQLVTISNDCFLFPRQELQKSLSISFDLWELSKFPTKEVFIEASGNIQSKLIPDLKSKQSLHYVQKATSIFINERGFCHDWEYNFPRKLYLDFMALKSREDLAKKLAENKKVGFAPFFCVFPSYTESQKLQEEYRKAGVDNNEFFFIFDALIPEKFIEKDKKNQEKIRKVNIDFIWEKRNQLKDFVDKYHRKELPYHKLLWLNEQLENVSYQIINSQDFLWGQIENISENNNEKKKDNRELGEIGMKTINELVLTCSHRVYGHYAYCCLELYNEIRKNPPCQRPCENEECGKLLPLNTKGNQRFCKNNLKCLRQRKKESKRVERENKKRQKKEKSERRNLA